MKSLGSKYKSASLDFKKFMNDYFTGPIVIRARGEEDIGVWQRLKGEELEVAKQKIIEELPSDQEYFMRAVAQFRDERALPMLTWTAEKGRTEHSRCYAAKVLYDWVGYDQYFERLEDVLKYGSQWSKINLDYWISGLDEENALKYFWRAMNDSDGFVRFCAYNALQKYYGVWRFRNDGGAEERYFTGEAVYDNKELFETRKAELKNRIEEWKKAN